MNYNKYDKAASLWVKRHFNLKDSDQVTNVEFSAYEGEGCDTCGYSALGLTFKLNGRYTKREVEESEVSPGRFVQECVELLA